MIANTTVPNKNARPTNNNEIKSPKRKETTSFPKIKPLNPRMDTLEL